MQAPFFAVAHALTRWTNLSPDGFTLYYQHARRLIRVVLDGGRDGGPESNCSGDISATASPPQRLRRCSLARISITTRRSTARTATHTRSSCLLRFSISLSAGTRNRGWRISILLGSVAGLIVLTRHTNAVALLFFPLYDLNSIDAIRARFALIRRERRLVTLIASGLGHRHLPAAGDLLRGHGPVFVSSYGDLGFTFASPHLIRRAVQRPEGALLLVAGAADWLCRLRVSDAFAQFGARFRAARDPVSRCRHIHHRELVGLAVRRELRPPGLRRHAPDLRDWDGWLLCGVEPPPTCRATDRRRGRAGGRAQSSSRCCSTGTTSCPTATRRGINIVKCFSDGADVTSSSSHPDRSWRAP